MSTAHSTAMTVPMDVEVTEQTIERIGSGSPERLDVEMVAQRRQRIADLMTECMVGPTKDNPAGVDYGIIPGCAKPTLLQPGAQKLINLFQLDPELEPMPDSVLEREFILHSYKCTLYSIASGKRIASGAGSCNSREDKYGMRTSKRVCPECGKATIIKGKAEYGGGWLCWQKQGKSDGCGKKFRTGDPAIESQPEGKTPNENIWEQENTIRKMAMKRALISAVLNATGASDIFTQDIEDMAEFQNRGEEEEKPHHRPGNEHYSSYCKDCQAAGVPKDLLAVVSQGNIYAKTAQGKALDASYPDKPIPAPKPPAASQDAPGRDLRPVTKDDDFKVWLASMAEAKKQIGATEYYRILKANQFDHANDVKKLAHRRAVRAQMADCYRMQQASKRAPSPADPQSGETLATEEPPDFQLGQEYPPEHQDE